MYKAGGVQASPTSETRTTRLICGPSEWVQGSFQRKLMIRLCRRHTPLQTGTGPGPAPTPTSVIVPPVSSLGTQRMSKP